MLLRSFPTPLNSRWTRLDIGKWVWGKNSFWPKSHWDSIVACRRFLLKYDFPSMYFTTVTTRHRCLLFSWRVQGLNMFWEGFCWAQNSEKYVKIQRSLVGWLKYIKVRNGRTHTHISYFFGTERWLLSLTSPTYYHDHKPLFVARSGMSENLALQIDNMHDEIKDV